MKRFIKIARRAMRGHFSKSYRRKAIRRIRRGARRGLYGRRR